MICFYETASKLVQKCHLSTGITIRQSATYTCLNSLCNFKQLIVSDNSGFEFVVSLFVRVNEIVLCFKSQFQ